MSSFSLRLTICGCLVAVLVACGGGAGTEDRANNPSPSPLRPPSAPLVLTVESPTHPADSQDLLGFHFLNQERSRCGFGLLAQDLRLDIAARSHREYLALNSVWAHIEVPGNPGFFGEDPSARAEAAGYELIAVGEGIVRGENAIDAMRGLLAAPYHAMNMLSGWTDVGVSFAYGVLVNLYGRRSLQQWTDEIRTYPCAESVGLHPTSTRETPAPFANFHEVWGHPILVHSPANFELRTAAITGPQGLVPIKVVYGKGHTDDRHHKCYGIWTCIIPNPLQPFTTYTVDLTWLQEGQPGGRSFSFTTGDR